MAKTTQRCLLCSIAFFLIFLSDWLTVEFLHSWFAEVFLHTRDISVGTRALVLIVAASVISRRPHVLNGSLWAGVAAMLVVSGTSMALAGMVASAPFVVVAGAVFLAAGRAWIIVVVLMAFLALRSSSTGLCLALSYTSGYLAKVALAGLPDVVVFVFVPLAALLALGLTLKLALPFFQVVQHSQPVEESSVLNPASYLPMGHQLFACVFLFQIAHGFALTSREMDGTPIFIYLPIVPLIIFAILLGTQKKEGLYDFMFKCCALLMIFGVLLSSVSVASAAGLANNVVMAGVESFNLLANLIFILVSQRNRRSAVFVFSWGQGLFYAGILGGAFLGRLGNQLYQINAQFSALLSLSLAFILMVYLVFVLGTYRFFSTTLNDITATSRPVLTENGETISEKCRAVQAAYALTPRELEVLEFLARGRNVPYIQEQLVVSANTIKAHVKHIYRKMNVHSQQQLIDLVEHQSIV